jgi:hypothetical protein
MLVYLWNICTDLDFFVDRKRLYSREIAPFKFTVLPYKKKNNFNHMYDTVLYNVSSYTFAALRKDIIIPFYLVKNITNCYTKSTNNPVCGA